MKFPQKIKNTVTIRPSNPSSGNLLEKLENTYSWRYMHPCAHFSTIDGGQVIETTKLSFDRGLDKEDAVHRYNGILLSCKKRWNTAICASEKKLRTVWVFFSHAGYKPESNKWTQKTNKQKLTDTDNSVVVTRGEQSGESGVKVVKIFGDKKIWFWVVGTQYSIQMMYHRIVHLKPT